MRAADLSAEIVRRRLAAMSDGELEAQYNRQREAESAAFDAWINTHLDRTLAKAEQRPKPEVQQARGQDTVPSLARGAVTLAIATAALALALVLTEWMVR